MLTNHLLDEAVERLLLPQLLGGARRVRRELRPSPLPVDHDLGLAAAAEALERVLELELRTGGVGAAIRAAAPGTAAPSRAARTGSRPRCRSATAGPAVPEKRRWRASGSCSQNTGCSRTASPTCASSRPITRRAISRSSATSPGEEMKIRSVLSATRVPMLVRPSCPC